MANEQKIRSFLFYLSLFIFLVGLPFILAFALSYKFNTRTLRFAKAGLIVLKTQPSGARVYLNGKLLDEKTPATINELLPGEYAVKIELEEYYPWTVEVMVSPGKVAMFDKIILFPLRSDVEQVSRESISYFWIDQQAGLIYYVSAQGNIIYRSDLDGTNFRKICNISFPEFSLKKWKLSPDKQTLLGFNVHQIVVVDLKSKASYDESLLAPYFILNYPRQKILDVFWHSDNYHIILLTDGSIDVSEAAPKASPVRLVTLNKNNASAYYDERADVIYFSDSAKASDDRMYESVYKLDLAIKFSPFKGLMKSRSENE